MLIAKYSGLFEYELVRIEGGFNVTLQHEFGQKWSNLLRYYTEAIVKNNLGISPQFDTISDRIVAFRFQIASAPPRNGEL